MSRPHTERPYRRPKTSKRNSGHKTDLALWGGLPMAAPTRVWVMALPALDSSQTLLLDCIHQLVQPLSPVQEATDHRRPPQFENEEYHILSSVAGIRGAMMTNTMVVLS